MRGFNGREPELSEAGRPAKWFDDERAVSLKQELHSLLFKYCPDGATLKEMDEVAMKFYVSVCNMHERTLP